MNNTYNTYVAINTVNVLAYQGGLGELAVAQGCGAQNGKPHLARGISYNSTPEL